MPADFLAIMKQKAASEWSQGRSVVGDGAGDRNMVGRSVVGDGAGGRSLVGNRSVVGDGARRQS